MVTPAIADAFSPSLSTDDADDGIRLIELSGGEGDRWLHSGLLDAYANRGFDAGRRRGYTDALSILRAATDDLAASTSAAASADQALDDLPPAVVRRVAAALAARVAAEAPPEQPGERTVEGGLGI